MGKRLKHFKTIMKHKAIVYRECKACGIWWQGVIHDLSKFSPAEFGPSAKHFQGNRSPIEAEKEKDGYSAAWMHHKGHNPHHWEYWIDYDKDGSIIANRIPYKYVVEMICDWVGAGMVYSQGDWKRSDPLKYYNKVRAGRHFHPETEKLILEFLQCIASHGLPAFHSMAKCEGKYAYLAVDYEGMMIP